MQNSNNDFNNLSIDNVNDNSVMFSFDLPRSQVNSQNTDDNSFIIPQIERLLSNTISRSILSNTTSRTNVTPPDSNNNEDNGDNDDNYDNYDNNDNDYQDID
jgi:hypothetical protein